MTRGWVGVRRAGQGARGPAGHEAVMGGSQPGLEWRGAPPAWAWSLCQPEGVVGPDGCLAGPSGLARALPEQHDLLAVTSCLGRHQLACPALQSSLPAVGCHIVSSVHGPWVLPPLPLQTLGRWASPSAGPLQPPCDLITVLPPTPCRGRGGLEGSRILGPTIHFDPRMAG